MSAQSIDPQLLMDLVRKYNVELLPNPIDRRAHWVKIAAEYNRACGTSLSHQSLSKKLANMKQRDRQKILAEKKKNLVMMKLGDNLVEVTGKDGQLSGDEAGLKVEDDEESQMEADEFVIEMEEEEQHDHHGEDDEDGQEGSDAKSKPYKIIRVVQDKGSLPSAQLVSAKGIEIDPKSEEAETCTRQGYENLLRDLLTCLAKKHRIEEPCGSSQVKHEIWRQLTNEYLQLTGGLVNVSQREVMRKWTNMKFNCKSKGFPHPLLRAEQLDIKEVEKKLKLCQRFVIGDDAMKPVETTRRIEAIKEKVKAKTIVEQQERDERPPLKLLERQILVETLRYEQERLQVLRENAKMEQERLTKDVILADIEIEKARCELELLKRRRQM